MAADREMRGFLNNANVVSALDRHYQKILDRIINELASGVSRPGGARTAELLRNIRDYVRELDPRRDSFVRDWIRRNVARAFVLGDRAATRDLQRSLEDVSSEQAAGFGSVNRGFGAANQTAMRAIAGAMEETLGRAADEMRGNLGLFIRRTQQVLVSDQAVRDVTVSGIIRGSTFRQRSDEIASILLGKKVSPQVRRELESIGFRAEHFNDFERVARGEMITAGKRRFNVRDYANLVARTQTREAHKVGTLVRLQQNAIDHVRVSTHVQGEADECTPFQGKVFYVGPLDKDPLGFPSLKGTPNGGPPFHPNSHLAGTVIDGCKVSVSSKREYTGKVVTLETASGNKTSITANHPVSTIGGFLPAKFLKEGDYVFSGFDSGQMSLASDKEYGPTEVSKLFQLAEESREFRRMLVPIGPEDFHGEGKQGQIAIVSAYRKLLDEQIPKFFEPVEKDQIILASGFPQSTKSGFPSRFDGVHSQKPGLSLSGFPLVHHGAEPFGGAMPSLLGRLSGHEDFGSVATIPRLGPGILKSIMDELTGDADFDGYLRRAYPGKVHLDRITRVTVREFSGHVYCLQSTSGLYTADGIIVHNCKHVITGFVMGFKTPEGIDKARNASAAIPRNFLGRSAGDVRKLVNDLDGDGLEDISQVA